MAASTLLTTDSGRFAMREICCYLLKRRMSRFFKGRLMPEAHRVMHDPNAILNMAAILGEFNDSLDPEILQFYRLLSQIGCLGESLMDTTIYVDATNGSDSSGDGTEDAPYQSFWFLPGLPDVIKHHYRIVLLTDIEMDDLMIDQTFDGEGSLSIIGRAAPIEGTQYTCQGFVGYKGANQISIPAAAWVADQLMGWWIRSDAATSLNEGWAIINNSTLNARTLNKFQGTIGTNDLFTLVQPALTLKTRSVQLASHGPAFEHFPGTPPPNSVGARIALINLNIDIRGTTSVTRVHPVNIYTSDSNVLMSFIRIMCNHGQTALQSTPVRIRGTFNRYASWDTQIDTLANCGLINLNEGTIYDTMPVGLIVHDTDGPYPGGEPQIEIMDVEYCGALVSTGVIKLSRNCYLRDVGARIFKTVIAPPQYTPGAIVHMHECAVCSDPAETSIQILDGSTYFRLDDVSFINNNSGVDLIQMNGMRFEYDGTLASGNDVIGGTAFSGFGMRIGNVCTIVLLIDPDDLTGALVDDWIFDINALQDEWPLVAATSVEGLGSYITRLA